MNMHNIVRCANLSWHSKQTLYSERKAKLDAEADYIWDKLTRDEKGTYLNVFLTYRCDGCDMCKELGIP